MIQKKVCMLGAFAVGKTSLVGRYVQSIFSEKYLTTVGVKIDKKSLEVGGKRVNLVLWDLHGEDEFQKVRTSYLGGASGLLLVVDGTRFSTLGTAYELKTRAEETLGPVPSILLLNKVDLEADWELDDGTEEDLAEQGWTVMRTSAKTGAGVEEAFGALAGMMMKE